MKAGTTTSRKILRLAIVLALVATVAVVGFAALKGASPELDPIEALRYE